MSNIYDLTDTWNNGATVYTSIKLNVTDTASDAASNLMDLQVGGVSKFRVDKSGFLSGADNANGYGPYDLVIKNNLYCGNYRLGIGGRYQAGIQFEFAGANVVVANKDCRIGWGSQANAVDTGIALVASIDTSLERIAAGTVGVNTGTAGVTGFMKAKHMVHAAAVTETIVPTKTLRLFDSDGVEYKVAVLPV